MANNPNLNPHEIAKLARHRSVSSQEAYVRRTQIAQVNIAIGLANAGSLGSIGGNSVSSLLGQNSAMTMTNPMQPAPMMIPQQHQFAYAQQQQQFAYPTQQPGFAYAQQQQHQFAFPTQQQYQLPNVPMAASMKTNYLLEEKAHEESNSV